MMSQSRARIFVELRVTGTGDCYGQAISFINGVNVNGLKNLETPSSGYVDVKKLMKFMPPPPRGYEYVEGPRINNDMLFPYAYAHAFRDEGSTWYDATINIIDVGSNGSSQMRNTHLREKNKKHVESRTVNECDATIYRAPDTGGEKELQIALAVHGEGQKLYLSFCPNCGSKVGETDKFCGECGTRIR